LSNPTGKMRQTIRRSGLLRRDCGPVHDITKDTVTFGSLAFP
jgi:hypothetical protein